jgi:hypothetical protein
MPSCVQNACIARPSSLETQLAIKRSAAAHRGVWTRTMGLPTLKQQAQKRAHAEQLALEARGRRIVVYAVRAAVAVAAAAVVAATSKLPVTV